MIGDATYDAVLLFNLLHHFDLVTNSKLLRKSAGACNQVAPSPFSTKSPAKCRVRPPMRCIRLIALQYYIMADGRVFTEDELETMLTHTGFVNTRSHGLSKLPGTSLMTATKP